MLESIHEAHGNVNTCSLSSLCQGQSTTVLLFHNVHTDTRSLGSQHSCMYWLLYMKFNIHVCAICQCFVPQDDQPLPSMITLLAPASSPWFHKHCRLFSSSTSSGFIYIFWHINIYIHYMIYIYSTHLVLLEYDHVDALLPGSGGLPCCHVMYCSITFKCGRIAEKFYIWDGSSAEAQGEPRRHLWDIWYHGIF